MIISPCFNHTLVKVSFSDSVLNVSPVQSRIESWKCAIRFKAFPLPRAPSKSRFVILGVWSEEEKPSLHALPLLSASSPRVGQMGHQGKIAGGAEA